MEIHPKEDDIRLWISTKIILDENIQWDQIMLTLYSCFKSAMFVCPSTFFILVSFTSSYSADRTT